MYIFLASLLFIIPSIFADQSDYRKEEQIFKGLPDYVKCDICGKNGIDKTTAFKNKRFLSSEFAKLKKPSVEKIKVTKVAACHDTDSDIVLFDVDEQTVKIEELKDFLSEDTYQYQIPFEVFVQWCKEQKEAYQEKLKATQQGDN